MKKFTQLFSVLAIIVMSFASSKVEASHFKGGDVFFECDGGSYYRLVFACYYACEAGSSTPYDYTQFTFDVTSSCGTVGPTIACTSGTTPTDVPFYCAGVLTTCDYNPYGVAPAGTPTGTLVVVYQTDSFYVPPGCTVDASISNGNRNGAISNLQNPSSLYIYETASITTPSDSSCNYNPLFAQYPVNIFCVNQNANFSHGAIDLNGDSLVYTLVNPEGQNFNGGNVIFTAGCDSTFPLGHPGAAGTFCSSWAFDSTTGNINFTPTSTGSFVLAVSVHSYHNGVLTGHTTRDIQFTVVSCAQPPAPVLSSLFSNSTVTGGLVLDSNHVGVCPGQTVVISLLSTDNDSTQTVLDTTNALASLPGSTVVYTHPNGHLDTIIMTLTWTPQGSDSGFHSFILITHDTVCPRPSRTSYGFIISVLRGVSAGPNQIYCNGGAYVTLHASGATHYFWTDSATGGSPVGVISYSPDSSTITVAPASAQGYVVHGNLIGGCRDKDTVMVANTPLFSLTTHAYDSVVCKYSRDTVATVASPSSVGPFTYHWSTRNPGDTFATIGTGPVLGNTLYRVTVTSVGGCAIRDSVNITINGSAPRIFITPSNDNVCPGDTVYLTSFAIAENLVSCGVVDTCPDNSILLNATCNNDTTSATGTNFTQYPGSPFRGNYNSYRVQYLFRASELNAVGLTSGSITDLAFFVKGINSVVPYDTFTVSMGCTTRDSLTSFVNGLNEVVPWQQYTPTLGWSSIPFTHFYSWDGASNLVIQVCYTIDPNQFSNDDYVSYTTTSFMGSTFWQGGFSGNGCALTPSGFFNGGPANTRPNIRFGMCTPDVVRYHWSPTPALTGCDTCPTIPIIVTRDTTIHISVSDYACHNDSSVTVHINPFIAFAATPHDTLLCNGGAVQLNATLTNAPPAVCLRSYVVQSIPYAALSGTQTIIPGSSYFANGGFNSQDDGVAGPFALPFQFPFYCNDYGNIWISTNAWVAFTNPYPHTGSAYTAQPLPYTQAGAANSPFNSIDFLWSDFITNANSTIGYFTTGTGANQTFVIQYNNLQSYSGGYSTNGQIQLHASGVVDILIQSSNYNTAFNPHTTGLSDTIGIGIAAPGHNDQQYGVSTPEAWRFIPVNGPSVVVNSSVWTPNLYLNNDSINNPISTTPVTQTYRVTSNLTINRYTHPTTCVVSDTARIRVASFHDTVTASVNPICPGDTTQLTFTGTNAVATINWTPTANIINTALPTAPKATITDTTWIHVVATDVNGCTVHDSIRLDVPAIQHPSLGANQTVCYNDSAPLAIVSGTYTNYVWYTSDSSGGNRVLIQGTTGQSTIFGHPRHYYVAYVHGGAGSCPYPTNVVLVDSFPRQTITVTHSGPLTFCQGGSVTLTATAGLSTYLWTSGLNTGSIVASTPGNYSYTAHDAHNCVLYSDTVPVVVNPNPTLTFSNTKNPICTGDIDTITAISIPAAGATYSWGATTGSTLAVTTAGIYTVTVTVNGCTGTGSDTVTSAVSPTVTLVQDQMLCDCHPNYVLTPTITPAAVTSYRWSNGTTSSTVTDTALGSQTYSISVTDAHGCTASAGPVTITINCPKVSITIYPGDTISKTDSTATLTAVPAGTGGVITYIWSPDTLIANQNNSVTHLNLTRTGLDTAYVRVVDSHGCMDSSYIVFFVNESDSFVMPNAFTPNGDGHNDVFYPSVGGGTASTAKVKVFRVYNRWGQTVHDNPEKGWDGNYGGAPQAIDTYTYFITVEYPDPRDVSKMLTKSIQGSMQLLR